ncbi:MAG TPA: pyrimidine dimer DNA glycosylase/endonuclease V, partial [Ktedonobacteraceae bacterium]
MKRRSFLMQTFLPCADFAESARILDNRRLSKQRVEGQQILNI